MTPQERSAKIESYGKASELLASALKEFPREMWTFKIAPNKWSIHEIIVHLADSEANSFVRGRALMAEPGKTIMAYDQDIWTTSMKYHEQSTDTALDLFRALRKSTYELIKTAPQTVWQNTIMHPESGTMTMEKWLEIYDDHTPKHIGQMRRNYEAWKQRK